MFILKRARAGKEEREGGGVSEKSLLMNRMTYARKQISRYGKRKWEKEIVNFSLEIYSNATWEVGEQGSFLDFNIKVYIHYSTAQTGGSSLNNCSMFHVTGNQNEENPNSAHLLYHSMLHMNNG